MHFEQIVKIRKELFGNINEFKSSDKLTPNPCWKGYQPIGLKPNGDPNCVPINKEKMEEFVIPTPEAGEKMNDYISRCMGVIGKENKPQDQLVAICVATYKNK